MFLTLEKNKKQPKLTSSTVEFELTSNRLDTRYWHWLDEGSPATRNSEHRSAYVKMPTFCKILWHKLRTSRSLQMSFTNSSINSVSSSVDMSVRDFFLICPVSSLMLVGGERKVGVPSMVVTRGLVRPPFSNSCADTLRTGVAPPDPDLELGISLKCGNKSSWFAREFYQFQFSIIFENDYFKVHL